jgi:hypothetical protein
MRPAVADPPSRSRRYDDQRPPSDDDLRPGQLVASGLAGAIGAAAASLFGVAGTVAGAALAGTLTTVGGPVLEMALRHTRNGLLTASSHRWGRFAARSLLAFVLAMGAVTAVELLTGESARDPVHGAHRPSRPAIVQLIDPPSAGHAVRAHHRTRQIRSAPASARPAGIRPTTTVVPPSRPPTATPADPPTPSPTTDAPEPTGTPSARPSLVTSGG